MITMEELHQKMENVLKEDPMMILAFRGKLVTDDMWEYAIAMKPLLFTQCKRPSYRIAAVAVSTDGLNISNVDPTMYTGDQYMRLCHLAVEQNPKAIIGIPKEFRNDDLVGYAYSRDPELILSEKKLTESLVTSIIDHNPSLIQYVTNPTDNLIIHALEKDPRVIVYFGALSQRVVDYYEEHYPQYASMLLRQ